MPRKPRAEYEKGVHHVYARGNRRDLIYRDDADRQRYLRMLARVTTRMPWSCLGYCLMGNHMHMLIETPRPNLGNGMHRLHGGYAQYFNRRHNVVGHLFQNRFDAKRVESDRQLFTVAAYVARNPVAAGLCAEPGDWPWSSHAAIVAGSPPAWLDAKRLLAYFGAEGSDSLKRYQELIEVIDLDPPFT